MAIYEVRLFSTSGQLMAVFDGWRNLEVNRKVNDVGDYVLTLDRSDKCDLFSLDCIVQVRRRVEFSPWYTEFEGFHRTAQDEVSETDTPIFTSYGVSLLDLIRRRCILYLATTAHTIKDEPGETAIKQFVDENAGPSAGDAARLVNGITPGLTIEATSGLGVNWVGARAWKNVLEVAQEIGTHSSVDFDIVRTTDANFEFRCYYPQMGTNRTSTVVFSLEMGNMISPSYSFQRTEETTVVAVLGGDVGAARTYAVRTSTDEVDSPWNHIEDTYDDREEDTLVNLQQDGDVYLEEHKGEEKLSFKVLQTYSLQYGRDYFLGDIVTAKFRDITRQMKITRVKLQVNDSGAEEVDIEFTTV